MDAGCNNRMHILARTAMLHGELMNQSTSQASQSKIMGERPLTSLIVSRMGKKRNISKSVPLKFQVCQFCNIIVASVLTCDHTH